MDGRDSGFISKGNFTLTHPLQPIVMFGYPVIWTLTSLLLWKTHHQINRELAMSTKHQVVWCITSRGMEGVVVMETKLWKILCPSLLLLNSHGPNEIQQGAVEPLAETVACWVVWGCPALGYTIQPTQLLDGC